MKKRLAILLSLSLLGGALTGCTSGSSNEPSEPVQPIPTHLADPTDPQPTHPTHPAAAEPIPLNASGLEADVAILQALYETDPTKNLIFSPVSLNTAIATYGSLLDDETAIANVRDYLGDKNYLAYRYEDESVYRSVNVIWADTGKELLNFDSAPGNPTVKWVDMAAPGATKIKDDFVSEMTEGFIESTPVTFTNETIMDIMNVLYFHDSWFKGDLDEFDDQLVFYNADGSKATLPYMIGRYFSESRYFAGEVSTAMPLRYENGMVFWAILPNEETIDFEGLAKDIPAYLNYENGVDRSESGARLNVYFEMPEFETTYNTGFAGTGVPGLISAPISTAICPYETRNGINQIAKIKVDKEGTTAAAVTEITLETTGIREPEPVEDYYFICDRPFVYLIYDTVNEDIAFMGILNEIE